MSFKKLFVASTFAAVSYAALTRCVTCPDGVNTATNAACCGFFAIRDDLQQNLFQNTCNTEVRQALRLTNHDAIAFSPTLGGGGADGSIITFQDVELTFAANGGDGGVEDFVGTITPFIARHNVTPGDFIFFASALGISNCAGTPCVQFFAGRPVAKAPAPDGLISQPTDDADTIITRFLDAGFSPDELVSLLAAHSIGAADEFMEDGHGESFDSTMHTFDTQFFIETRLTNPVNGETRLGSDQLLARDDRTACMWQSFITQGRLMRERFAASLFKMSSLGQDINNMVDCSELIPEPATIVDAPFFPGNATISDVDPACAATPFPSLLQNPALASVTPAGP